MEIHLARSGRKLGKFSLDDVNRRLASGELQTTDLAWMKGWGEWASLGTVPGVIPPGSGTPPPAEPLPRIPELVPIRTVPSSGLAIASLVCGILSVSLLPILAAIPAIIFGHIALPMVRNSRGGLKGEGFAVAGLITGYGGLVLAALIAIAFPVFSQIQLRAKQTQSLSTVRQIAIACKAYATDHDGDFPPKLENLVPKYLPDSLKLICPLSGPDVPIGYDYFGGKDSDAPDKVLLASKATDRKGRRVLAQVDTNARLGPYTPNLFKP